jgi:zinc transporter
MKPASGTLHATPDTAAPSAGIVWAYRFRENGEAEPIPGETVDAVMAARPGWVWVHLGLADLRARTWVHAHAPISAAARDLLLGSDEHMRLDMIGGEMAGVLPDLQRDLASCTEDIVRLRFVMSERFLITTRRSPVHSVEAARRAIANGHRFPAAINLFDTIVDQFADEIGRVTEKLGNELDQVERQVLHDEIGNERPTLGRIRLQAVRLHRQMGLLQTLFHRLEPRVAPDNRDTALAIRALAQKINALHHEAASLHERTRLLLDEVAGKATAITNRRLFALSLLTACLLPPTLVTGFFGMNTKDMPLQNTDGGSWLALLIAAAAGALSYWALARIRAL